MAVIELTEEEIREASSKVEQAIMEEVVKGLSAAQRSLAWSRELLEYLGKQ